MRRSPEGVSFGGTLHFDETAAVVHHHVHVGVAVRILGVIEVEHGEAVVNADRHRGDGAEDGVALDRVALRQRRYSVYERHIGARDGGRARAAVGLDHVAVQRDDALAERGAVHAGAQRAPDEALDLHGAPALAAARGFALGAVGGGAGQHAVFGGDPALALAAKPRRHAFLDGRGAQHLGVAEGNQHGALGVAGVMAFDADGAQLVGGASAGADGGHVGPDLGTGGGSVYHWPPFSTRMPRGNR